MGIQTTTLIKMAAIAQEYGRPFSAVVASFAESLSYKATCATLGFSGKSRAMKDYKHLFKPYLGTGKNIKSHLAQRNKSKAYVIEGKTLSEIAVEHRLTYTLVAQRYRKGANTIHDLTKPYVRKFGGRKPPTEAHKWKQTW